MHPVKEIASIETVLKIVLVKKTVKDSVSEDSDYRNQKSWKRWQKIGK